MKKGKGDFDRSILEPFHLEVRDLVQTAWFKARFEEILAR
jgi:hypothetical protein